VADLDHADPLCAQFEGNHVVDRSTDPLCYLDYKQKDPCNTEICNGSPIINVVAYSTEEFKYREGRGVDYVDFPGDLNRYTMSGKYTVMRAVYDPDEDAAGEFDDGSQDGAAAQVSADGTTLQSAVVYNPVPRVDRFTRSTLLQTQRPESVVIIDATDSYDPDDAEPRIKKPLDPDWEITWAIIGHDETQTLDDPRWDRIDGDGECTDVTGPNDEQCTPSSTPKYDYEAPRMEDYPDSEFLTEAEIIAHLGEARVVALGGIAKQREQGRAAELAAGLKLAKHLLRKVTFDPSKTDPGAWQFRVKIVDDSGMPGEVTFPLMVANCEAPELQIEWDGVTDGNINRTNSFGQPMVNPSDKVKIQGTVWYFGMGDVRRQANPSTKRLWLNNKDALQVTWQSVSAVTYMSFTEPELQNAAGTELVQKSKVLQTVAGLEKSNLVLRTWMLNPADPGISEYSKYMFRLTVDDICSQGRPPITAELSLVVNSPPHDGYMTVDKRYGTA
jgi:hypothetical protein